VTDVPVTLAELQDWCAQEGFRRIAVVPSRGLPPTLSSHPEIAALGAGTYLLAGLSCFRREPEDLSGPGDPHGLIAPFARRNYYREAVLRLRRVAERLAGAAGLERKVLRIFCNSRLPEKPLAVAAGLGAYGRNALVIAPGLGSLFVIAGMFVPAGLAGIEGGRAKLADDGPEGRRAEGGRLCGSCTACQAACPVDALAEAGRLDESRCLQAQAGREGDLPEELARAWGYRLYGCQVCQEVCPFNRQLEHQTPTRLGELGPSLSLRRVLGQSAEELAQRVRGTALGMSWISKRALQRNALLAVGHRGRSAGTLDPALRVLLADYRRHRDPALARAAAWAAAWAEGPPSGQDGEELS
jgi:epoxyqueuosine reductase